MTFAGSMTPPCVVTYRVANVAPGLTFRRESGLEIVRLRLNIHGSADDHGHGGGLSPVAGEQGGFGELLGRRDPAHAATTPLRLPRRPLPRYGRVPSRRDRSGSRPAPSSESPTGCSARASRSIRGMGERKRWLHPQIGKVSPSVFRLRCSSSRGSDVTGGEPRFLKGSPHGGARRGWVEKSIL